MSQVVDAIRRRGWTIGGGLAGALLSLPLLSFHFCWDHGVYATIADTLMRGGVAYRDAWEFRPPGAFYAYVTAFTLFGRSEGAVRILEIISVAFTSGGLAHLFSTRFESPKAGLAAAAFLPFIILPFGHWHTAQPESFQMPFVLWSLALWPRPDEKIGLGLRCAIAGALLGAAAVIKTTAFFMAPVLLADRLVMDGSAPEFWKKIRLSLVTLLSGSLPCFAVAIYYGARGAFRELWDAVMLFAPHYLRTYGNFSARYHADQIRNLAIAVLPPGVAIAFGCGLLRGILVRRAETLWLATFGVIALGEVVLQAKYIPYHALVVTPFIAAGVGLVFVRSRTSSPAEPGGRMFHVRWIALALSVLTASAAALEAPFRVREYWLDLGRLPDARRAHQGNCRDYYEESLRLSEAIRVCTEPGDSIFLWANTPLPYFLSGRPMAGPYSSLFLVCAPWLGEERVRSLIDRLSLEKPKLIVIGADDALWVPEDSRRLLEIHAEMKTFLTTDYRQRARAGKYQFWFRIE